MGLYGRTSTVQEVLLSLETVCDVISIFQENVNEVIAFVIIVDAPIQLFVIGFGSNPW